MRYSAHGDAFVDRSDVVPRAGIRRAFRRRAFRRPKNVRQLSSDCRKKTFRDRSRATRLGEVARVSTGGVARLHARRRALRRTRHHAPSRASRSMGGGADTRDRVVRASAGSPRARPRERPDAVLSSPSALLPDGGSPRSRRGPGPRARVPRHEGRAVRASRGARPARRGSQSSSPRGRPGASLRGRARELSVRRGPRRPGRPVLVRDPGRRRSVPPKRNHHAHVRVARV